MSFPPPQPPIPPGMAPPMMPPGYGFPPMGMMPMMGMIPPMMRTTAPSTTTSAVATTVAKPSKKLVPQEIPKESEEKPPVTTVFVGNISDRAPDAMVRQMLQRCGNVLSWKRVQGASGKLQAFGFCEYESPEATLCCIRLLNDWKIVDKNLMVKVDAKTKTLLEEYKKKKAAKKAKEAAAKKAEAAEEGEDVSSQNGSDNDLDEFTLREDRVAKAGLDAIMREYAEELAKEPPPDLSAEEKKEKRKEKIPAKKDEAKEGIDEMDLEEEERDLINREINKFRDAHKMSSGYCAFKQHNCATLKVK